ncbi:hypothetical protein Rsub_00557 [Raphidocelis subcapitata]|uniref:STI1 domain-containing protein n=1 Tax=Raphidocelis subcapitata TaxID=307507 RepID=A0A2V0NSM9_9CHLO|nr:hypothetical protein Rsub_00557 [Raphidocelis subcapitata]|eukprot:GBF87845.1 hypothetical protein Rsub_00557 [Raphidocelis subcapitata]
MLTARALTGALCRAVASAAAQGPPAAGAPACARVAAAARAALQAHWQQQQQRRELSSDVSGKSSSSSGGGGGGGGAQQAGGEAAASSVLQMMETLMADPAAQQLLLARMPPHMRRPEVLKAMMANPEVRQRIAALAQQTGLGEMFGGLAPDRVAAGIGATRQAGMDPGALFSRFMASPSLAAKLRDPRVLAALTDVVANGPGALQKYSGDAAVVEAWNEAAGILEAHQKAEAAAGGNAAAAAEAAEAEKAAAAAASARACRPPPPPPGLPPGLDAASLARAREALGVSPEELMRRALARPELLARVRDPEVQAALAEVAAKPWKVVKHLFNPKVMGALKEMRSALKEARESSKA